MVRPCSWWPSGSSSPGRGSEDRREFQSSGRLIEASVTAGAGVLVATMKARSCAVAGEVDLAASERVGREKSPRLSSGHFVRR